MGWCFAIVNGRLAEIYFDQKKGKAKIWGHCYVKKQDYKTKKEKQWIAEDVEKVNPVRKDRAFTLSFL